MLTFLVSRILLHSTIYVYFIKCSIFNYIDTKSRMLIEAILDDDLATDSDSSDTMMDNTLSEINLLPDDVRRYLNKYSKILFLFILFVFFLSIKIYRCFNYRTAQVKVKYYQMQDALK